MFLLYKCFPLEPRFYLWLLALYIASKDNNRGKTITTTMFLFGLPLFAISQACRAESCFSEPSSLTSPVAHTHTFINEFYREKLPFPSGIAPGTDLTFVGDPSTNSPPKTQIGYISVYSISYLNKVQVINTPPMAFLILMQIPFVNVSCILIQLIKSQDDIQALQFTE